MEFFVYFTMTDGEPMVPPSPEGMADMMKFMEESMQSGMVVSTGQLGSTTTHVRQSEGKISVTDGPFIEGKELIPGFTIIRVDSRQEAIEWTTKLRKCMGDGVLRMAQISLPGME